MLKVIKKFSIFIFTRVKMTHAKPLDIKDSVKEK